jgi:hypothetical protein
MRVVRITGSGFVKMGAIADGHPVEFRHWQEVVDECDRELESAASSEEEEAVVELWLEDPMSFQAVFDEEEPGIAPQTRTGSMLRRADNFGRKQAVVREANWDQEFADAQLHVASVLKNLGNGR